MASKLKILLACEQPLPSKKRAGRPNYTLEYLSKWGYDITVVCPQPVESFDESFHYNVPSKNSFKISNVRFRHLPMKFDQFSIINRFKIMRSLTENIRSEINENHFDVVRANGLIPHMRAYSVLDAKDPCMARSQMS